MNISRIILTTAGLITYDAIDKTANIPVGT